MMSDVCKHCSLASCMEVCPTNAIIRTEFDTVYIQPDVCNGCRDCIAACPYDVIGFNEKTGLAQKCTFCYERLQNNLIPACAKACPTESIKFGELSEMRTVATAAPRAAARPGRGRGPALRARRSTAACTRSSCSPTSRRPTSCPTPRTRCCPSRNNVRSYLGSLATAVLGLVGAVIAFRQRGGEE